MTVVSATSATLTTITADCTSIGHAIGGGLSSPAKNLEGSFPSTAGGVAAANGSTNPKAWTAVFSAAAIGQTVYALCVP